MVWIFLLWAPDQYFSELASLLWDWHGLRTSLLQARGYISAIAWQDGLYLDTASEVSYVC